MAERLKILEQYREEERAKAEAKKKNNSVPYALNLDDFVP